MASQWSNVMRQSVTEASSTKQSSPKRALVGINAVVLDGAHIGERSIVAAGSVVTEGTPVLSETTVAGTPAEQKKPLKGDETERWAHYYSQLAQKQAETSKRL